MALLIMMLGCGSALAAGPQQHGVCAPNETNDTLRSLPPSLVGAARDAFGLRAPARLIERGTVWRCVEGRKLACFVGANLPCGKLDRNEHLPAVEMWCSAHPGAPVPASVSGHETLWRWRCDGAAARRDGQAWRLDARGFAAELWKPLQ